MPGVTQATLETTTKRKDGNLMSEHLPLVLCCMNSHLPGENYSITSVPVSSGFTCTLYGYHPILRRYGVKT